MMTDRAGASRLAIIDKKTHVVINIVIGTIAWAQKVYTDSHPHYFIDVGHPPDIGWTFDQTSGRFVQPKPE
jgi:hypothetical protein